MRITIADVAARAGVSKTTVSRVLNSKGELDQETAARVKQVIHDLGYVPSSGAVGLARGRTDVVAALIPSLTWPWMGDVLQGVIDAVEAAGRGLMLFTCNRGDESMQRFASQVSARSFDGLVVIEPEGTTDYIAGLHANGLPVVMIDDRASQPGFPSVVTTNYEGAAAAARHLIETGRRRPVVIRGSEQFGCTAERLAGFADVYAGHGIPIGPERVVDGEFSLSGGERVVREMLAAGVEFDAVFAHNDLSAAGAVRVLQATDRRIPQDVSVVGFDDVPLTEVTVPALTSVHQPLREMGEAAANMLISFIDGVEVAESRRVIPTTLTIRESSAATS